MKRYTFLFLIFIGSHSFLIAQEEEKADKLKIGLNVGFAYFTETDLEKLNTDVAAALPMEVQTINSFPATITYGGCVLTRWNSWFALGPCYQYYTTGSRLGAKDYSGTHAFDQIISAHSPGIQAEVLLKKTEKYVYYFEALAGVHFAKWKIEENIKLHEESLIDVKELTAIKPFLFPRLKIAYPITQNLSIATIAGYSFDFGGKYKLNGNSKSKSPTNVPFSGVKVMVTIEYER